MWHAADAQRRRRSPGAPCLSDCGVEAGENLARLAGQDASRLGRAHHPAGPFEQLHAELQLELADRLRQRRLRDAKARGRATEVQLLEDREEVAQVPELDCDRRRAARFGS